MTTAKLTPKHKKAIKELPRQVRRVTITLPSLLEIENARLRWPEQLRLLALHARCRKIFRDMPGHWSVKAARQLDRLTFPDLTQGKGEMEQERLAGLSTLEVIAEAERGRFDCCRVWRLLSAFKATAPNYDDLLSGFLGSKLPTELTIPLNWTSREAMLREVEAHAHSLTNLLRDLRRDKSNGVSLPKARIYSFLLRNAEAIEQCRTVAEVTRLPGFPKFDQQALIKLFKKLGLPAATSRAQS